MNIYFTNATKSAFCDFILEDHWLILSRESNFKDYKAWTLSTDIIIAEFTLLKNLYEYRTKNSAIQTNHKTSGTPGLSELCLMVFLSCPITIIFIMLK